jgi:hypothetical protein
VIHALGLHAILAGLTWDPQIRGAAIVIVAFLILPGSVYLLLATNMGARMGFLLALAGITGWISVMAVIWMVYGIGLKGRDPSWKPREVITGNIRASTIAAVDGFPKGWIHLPDDSPEVADAQAAVDKLVVRPTGAAAAAAAEAGGKASKFAPMFSSTADYVRVAGYRKGGDNYLFKARKHKFFLHHSTHYEIVQIQPALAQPDFGGSPPKPVPDTRQPITSIVMVRDLGSIRFPPFTIAVSSMIVFGVVCNALHRRDKEIWAKQAAEAAGEGDKLPEPEPVHA